MSYLDDHLLDGERIVYRAQPLYLSRALRTGGRVAEGVGLENRYTRKGIVGSNPTLSALNACSRSYLSGFPAGMLLYHPDTTVTTGLEWQIFASGSSRA